MNDISTFATRPGVAGNAGESSLKFGTSGLRGLVTDLVGLPSRAYALAFVRHMLAISAAGTGEILIGRDLRSSSPQIALDCAAACNFAGLAAVDCGALPTPALALEAQRRGCPAIMVTGSHIPDDRNGLKFYHPDGEVTKADEIAVLEQHQALLAQPGEMEALAALSPSTVAPVSSVAEDDPLDHYIQRYTEFFPANALTGVKVGVYQHSSVVRDALVTVLSALGADVVAFGRSAHFIPVDTEAHSPEQLAMIAAASAEGGFSAIVSSDGDADRPLVADERGVVLRGDVVGLMTAAFLNAGSIVTPVTSGSVIERSGVASQVLRTRVGSPYVIEGMGGGAVRGTVVGFEANGGVLLGSDVTRHGRSLCRLPTRDALLPILAVLSVAVERGKTVGETVADLDVGFAKADRLKDVPGDVSARLLSQLAFEPVFRRAFFADVGSVVAMSQTDGVRIELDDGSTVHFRASGNAPELRCYVEARDEDGAETLLAWGLRAAGRALQSQ